MAAPAVVHVSKGGLELLLYRNWGISSLATQAHHPVKRWNRQGSGVDL